MKIVLAVLVCLNVVLAVLLLLMMQAQRRLARIQALGIHTLTSLVQEEMEQRGFSEFDLDGEDAASYFGI